MSKIGIKWNTLENETQKSLIIVISKTYARFSPSMLIQSLTSLNEIGCSLILIEKISHKIKMENEKIEFEINRRLEKIEEGKFLSNFEEVENNGKEVQEENDNNEKKTILKKRKSQPSEIFERKNLVKIIYVFVHDQKLNNWEMVHMLTVLSALGKIIY